MAFTATQISACFQTYWYMWLTNGLSGLLFLGIQIGIAAFFLKKFATKKPSNYHRPVSTETSSRRPFTPSDLSSFDASAEQNRAWNTSALSVNNLDSIEDNDEFSQSTLQAINSARVRCNASPLYLNDQLSQIAQRWAEQMARTGKLEHSPAEWRSFGRQTLGENYAASFQVELTGDKMVKKWLREGKRYMFGYDGRKDTENFTQLVWQTSQEVGVGRARSEDGNWWYGVVIFDPPGNIPNQYSTNVFLPPQF